MREIRCHALRLLHPYSLLQFHLQYGKTTEAGISNLCFALLSQLVGNTDNNYEGFHKLHKQMMGFYCLMLCPFLHKVGNTSDTRKVSGGRYIA